MPDGHRYCKCRSDGDKVSWTGLGFAVTGSFCGLFIIGSAVAAAVIFGG